MTSLTLNSAKTCTRANKGVDCKLHAVRFIDGTPGKLIDRDLSIEFHGHLLCGNLTVASGQEKILYIKGSRLSRSSASETTKSSHGISILLALRVGVPARESSHGINGSGLAGFKEALRPFSVERPKPRSGTFSGRFGSDLGSPPGLYLQFLACISDSRPVTLIFRGKSESFC